MKTSTEHGQLLAESAATIDRMLGDVKVAAAGGRRRRAGFYSAIRAREVPRRVGANARIVDGGGWQARRSH